MAGRKIDDHGSWIGKGGKYPLPMESKMKEESSAEGAGGIMDYPDTTEAIKRDQGGSASKLKGRPLKPGYRY